MKNTIRTLQELKAQGRRFPMLTVYEAPAARWIEAAGIPVLLVGDSLGTTVLGFDTTLPVTMEDMVRHTSAVTRAVEKALVVADLPFLSYQASTVDALTNGGRLLAEGGADAVKLEGGAEICDQVSALISAGIPVMGHIGLTPQAVNQLGGYRVQGRDSSGANRILEDAIALEKAGAFAIVLEAVPSDVAKSVTSSVDVPTIGIGAGPECDGQVLVFHDFLGISVGRLPKFVKTYASIGQSVQNAAQEFAREVEAGLFPTSDYSYD